jgi:hypothetical protein
MSLPAQGFEQSSGHEFENGWTGQLVAAKSSGID